MSCVSFLKIIYHPKNSDSDFGQLKEKIKMSF